jgi:hypothetical protein
VTDPLSAAEVEDFQDELDALIDRAPGTLVGLWQMYVSSFQGVRTAPAGPPPARGTRGRWPPRLHEHAEPARRGLTGSGGGDLDWLRSSGVQDVMHFQLKSADRPAL